MKNQRCTGKGMNTYERLQDGTLRTAIPEPYWVRRWWTLFRWKPACYECKTVFLSREQYDDHFIINHAYSEVPDDRS